MGRAKKTASNEGQNQQPGVGSERLAGCVLLALLSFVLLLDSLPAPARNELPSGSVVAAVMDAVSQQAQAAYTVAVQVANDLRVVWEIRALMNSRQAEPAAPAPAVPERPSKTCSRG